MSSLYIHVPFCLQKCKYCDFVSFERRNGVPDAYVKCVCTEIEHYHKNSVILDTIYIGGGTPSLLFPAQLAQILASVQRKFTLAKNLEFTLETNPETYEKKKFLEFQRLGVNRISLGVQSFDRRYLSLLGRVHSKERAGEALGEIRGIFANVSVDLMNALPGQTLAEARADLLTAAKFSPQHISCYELTYEKGAVLAAGPKNELDVEMYTQTKEILETRGYAQYEISNYARADFESRHNLAYWSDKSYLGVGLSAHSYDAEEKIRRANTGDLQKYLSGDFLAESEPENDFNKIMMGLRKNSGIPADYLNAKQKRQAEEFSKNDWLILTAENCRLTDAGRLFLNKILLELM